MRQPDEYSCKQRDSRHSHSRLAVRERLPGQDQAQLEDALDDERCAFVKDCLSEERASDQPPREAERRQQDMIRRDGLSQYVEDGPYRALEQRSVRIEANPVLLVSKPYHISSWNEQTHIS